MCPSFCVDNCNYTAFIRGVKLFLSIFTWIIVLTSVCGCEIMSLRMTLDYEYCSGECNEEKKEDE